MHMYKVLYMYYTCRVKYILCSRYIQVERVMYIKTLYNVDAFTYARTRTLHVGL